MNGIPKGMLASRRKNTRTLTHENGMGVVRMRSKPVNASVSWLIVLMIKSAMATCKQSNRGE